MGRLRAGQRHGLGPRRCHRDAHARAEERELDGARRQLAEQGIVVDHEHAQGVGARARRRRGRRRGQARPAFGQQRPRLDRVAQRRVHVSRARGPVLRARCEQAREQLVEGRERRVPRRRPGRRTALRRVRALTVGRVPRQHLEPEAPERVQVGRGRDRLATLRQLRRAEARRAVAVGRAAARPSRDAEVDQHRPTRALLDHDVGGLDVAVDDAGVVRRAEAAREVAKDGRGAPRGDAHAVLRVHAEDLLQGLALDVLHREEEPALVRSERVDRDDVPVAHGRQRGGLATERTRERGRGGVLRTDHLQRHLAPEVHVLGEHHDAQGARAELREGGVPLVDQRARHRG